MWPVDLFHLDLVVGEGGSGGRIPVDEALAAIDEAVAEQLVRTRAARPSTHISSMVNRVRSKSHDAPMSSELFEDDGARTRPSTPGCLATKA